MAWLYDNPLINFIAMVMGYILQGIYMGFEFLGIYNIGLCIIVFTIVIRMLMLPMQIKQQKFARLNSVMSPEIKKIQDKYKDKKDQASQMAQQDEIKAVYAKYGTSPTGSCLQLVIQMPILFALYAVIRNVPKYVAPVRRLYETVIYGMSGSLMKTFFATKKLVEGNSLTRGVKGTMWPYIERMTGSGITGKVNRLAEHVVAGKKVPYTLNELLDAVVKGVPTNADVAAAAAKIKSLNHFCGMDISMSPQQMWDAKIFFNSAWITFIIVAIIPVLSGIFQFLSVKLSTKLNKQAEQNQPAALGGSMKMMNYIMPIFSVWICFSFPLGIGIYWCMGSLVMIIQQIFINRHLNKMDINDIIDANKEKAAQKAEKRKEKKGIYRDKILEQSNRSAKSAEKGGADKAENEAKIAKAKEAQASGKGSLASKAGLVQEFNKKNNK